MEVNKIFLAETPEEVLAITQTSNLADAERVAIEAYDQSYSTVKSIIYRTFFVCVGLFLLYFSLIIPPLFLFSFFFLGMSFFGRMYGKRKLREKITELQTLVKELDGYPELVIRKNFADSFPKSAFGSRAASINDIGNFFFNSDTTKHLWKYAGFSRIDTGRESHNHAEWQHYYIFIYPFHGSVPQMLLLNKQDRFLPLSSPNNKVLADDDSLWRCVVPDEYEIEALAIFTQDVVLKLIEKSAGGPACTFEFSNSSLFCFIPVSSPNIKELFVHEKSADAFAAILLPQLEKATMATIGNIPTVLSVDVAEEGAISTESSEDEKRRQKWMVFIFIFSFVATLITANLSAKGVIPSMVIFPVTTIPPLLIFLLMSKRVRKQWIDGSGLRVNGRGVRISKETE